MTLIINLFSAFFLHLFYYTDQPTGVQFSLRGRNAELFNEFRFMLILFLICAVEIDYCLDSCPRLKIIIRITQNTKKKIEE